MVHCSVFGCKSRSERKDKNITFHTFPKDPDVRKSWILSTGRSNWEPKKYDRICSRHFVENCFRKTLLKVYLNAFSVPTLNVLDPTLCDNKITGDLQEENSVAITSVILGDSTNFTQIKEMDCGLNSEHLIEDVDLQIEIPATTTASALMGESSRFSNTGAMDCVISSHVTFFSIIKSPGSETTYTPRKKKLVKKLKLQTLLSEKRKKKLAVLRSRNHRLQKRNAEMSVVIEKLQSKFLINQEAADLLSTISTQNKSFLKSNKGKFSPEVRKFALNLHFISPRAYDFVRNMFNTCLPHTPTLARWYQTIDGEPGFSIESLDALKLLARSKSPKKWICGLCFDEMAIRKAIEWNGKNYVGFVNYGHQVESDDLPVAKEVLVFMLTCLNGSWKLPLGYFLINGVTAEQKVSLVKTCIDLISECGLDLVSVTFDGCAANFAMAKLLGCNLEGDLNPVFEHNDKKIVVFPDPSHMLTLVRNTLGDKLFLKNAEGETISWNFIKLLVELQENEGFHLANKIRSAHINYKKQIMKVKLAAQLFSESVADSMEFCYKELRLEEFHNCTATVEFIRNFNTLFDIMNTRNLNAYAYKKPLMLSNFESINTFLNDMLEYIKTLKIGSVNILDSNSKTGFLGFLLSIKAVLFLYEKLVVTKCLDFLSSYKLSQDHLEIFFSAIRAKGGFNNNPTATQFKSAYKRMLVHGELKHLVTGNCIPLSDIHILTYSQPELAINKTTDRNRLINENLQENFDSELVVPKDHDYLADPTRLTEFSRQVIVYIAGFIIKAMESQIKCEQCLAALYSPCKIDGSLQSKKDKGGLRYPSRDLINLCIVAEEVHRKTIMNKKEGMHQLLQKCMKKCIGLNLFAEVSHDISNSINHYPLLIKAICKKYLNVRLHYATKRMVNKEDSVRNLYTKLILFKGQ